MNVTQTMRPVRPSEIPWGSVSLIGVRGEPFPKMVKTIPTNYRGVEFRSRTEARWAVFMSELGVRYEYEPEGYDLGPAGWYIPDFWLPDLDLFIEIKPSAPVPGRESPTGALCLATKKNVITFCGPPTMTGANYDWREDGYLDTCVWSGRDASSTLGGDSQYWFCCCPICKRVGIEFNGRSDRIGCECKKSAHGDKGYNSDDPVIYHAYRESANAFKFKKP